MILKDYTLTFSHSTEPERQDPTLKCHLFLSLTIIGLKQCTFPEVNCAVCGTDCTKRLFWPERTDSKDPFFPSHILSAVSKQSMHDLGIALWVSSFLSGLNRRFAQFVVQKLMILVWWWQVLIFKANWTHDSPIAAPENELNRRRLFAISVTIKWAKRSNRFAMKERP